MAESPHPQIAFFESLEQLLNEARESIQINDCQSADKSIADTLDIIAQEIARLKQVMKFLERRFP